MHCRSLQTEFDIIGTGRERILLFDVEIFLQDVGKNGLLPAGEHHSCLQHSAGASIVVRDVAAMAKGLDKIGVFGGMLLFRLVAVV